MGNTSKNGRPRCGRPPIEPEKLNAFLDALAEYGSVRHACDKAGIARVTAYRHREYEPDFAEAWERAAAIGARALEDEARRRAYEGWEEPAGWHHGEAGGTVRKFSDTLLIFLLKGHYPEKYRERVSAEVGGPGGGPVEVRHTVTFVEPRVQEG